MSVISRIAVIVLLGVLLGAGVLVQIGGSAAAQSAPARVVSMIVPAPVPGPVVPIARATVTPATPPPLPFGNGNVLTPGRTIGKNPLALLHRPLPPLPARFLVRKPNLAQALRDMKTGRRHINAANGGTIILDAATFANTPYGDPTVPYGDLNFLICEGMKATTNYEYVIFPPSNGDSGAGSGADLIVPNATPVPGQSSDVVQTNSSGICNGGAEFNFQTPFPGGSDAPYPGVWAAAMLNI